MQLMFEKGLVVRNERYRSHLYEARAPKEQTQRQIAGDLLKRAFEGSAKSLLLGALAAQPARPRSAPCRCARPAAQPDAHTADRG
jgi:predicted transcriptional regulator